MNYFKSTPFIFCLALLFGCGQGEQQSTSAKAESASDQKVKNPEKLPGERLQQAGQTMNKAAEVEKEIAKKAEENERKIEQESK
jgi:hypothetical protein